jgi:hypothetical protein
MSRLGGGSIAPAAEAPTKRGIFTPLEVGRLDFLFAAAAAAAAAAAVAAAEVASVINEAGGEDEVDEEE